MTRNAYLRTLLQHYVDAPDTPDKPSRRDWAVAGDLYRKAVPLPDLLHAIRLATLRRHLTGPHPPIHSLAYYREALGALSDDELDAEYVAYVKSRHQLLRAENRLEKVRRSSRNRAPFHRR